MTITTLTMLRGDGSLARSLGRRLRLGFACRWLRDWHGREPVRGELVRVLPSFRLAETRDCKSRTRACPFFLGQETGDYIEPCSCVCVRPSFLSLLIGAEVELKGISGGRVYKCLFSCSAVVCQDNRPSHACNARAEHVGVFCRPDRLFYR